MPEQRTLWEGVAKEFAASNEFVGVDLDHRVIGDSPPSEPLPDVFECVDRNLHRNYQGLGLLRLRDYLRDSSEVAPERFLDDGLAEIYNQSAFFYCDVAALKRLGMDVPSFDSLDGQMDFLGAFGAGRRIPSVLYPSLLAGSFISDMVATVRKGRDPGRRGLPERFQSLVRLACSFTYPSDERQFSDKLFVERKIPVFLGGSYHLQSFKWKKLPFEWMAVPVLNIEGDPVRIPVAAAASERTAYPMECVRWVRHLLSAGMRRRFAEFGYLTDSMDALRKYNCSAEGVQLLKERFQAAHPMFAVSRADAYVGISIGCAELFDCAAGRQDPNTAWRDILAYTRAYLSGQK